MVKLINSIWFFMILASLIYAAVNGTMPAMSDALMSGANDAVELSIYLLGGMCVWMGFLKIAEASGLTVLIAKILSPVIDRLFPEYKNEMEIKGKISMNITANFLGLGNAATPLGLSAMKAMEKKNSGDSPTSGMILFVVINTASLQLLPVNMAAIRDACGSSNPFGILPQVWVTSAAALVVCVLFCKLAQGRLKWKR